MSLGDEVKSENNTPFSIQICRGYNNVANTFRLAAVRTVLNAKVGANMRIQYRRLYQSIAEEAILQATYVSILLRRHYCTP